jgi:hypothetical protein
MVIMPPPIKVNRVLAPKVLVFGRANDSPVLLLFKTKSPRPLLLTGKKVSPQAARKRTPTPAK